MDEPQPPSPYAPPPNSPFGQPPIAYGQPPGGQPHSPYGQPPGGQPHNPYGQPPGGQPHNPYAAPAYDAAPGWQMGMDDHGILASRGSRFLGSCLDGLVYMLALIPMFIIMAIGGSGGDAELMAGLGFGLPMLFIAFFQWYLISTTGQSIAKKMLGMKIIKTTGEDVDFVSGVLMRSWVPAFIGVIPVVGGIFPLVDALFIFGDEHQCLHDKIASTKVISI